MELNLQKIKGRMTEKQVTYQELADYLDITEQGLGNKLNGRTDFKHSELTKIFTKLEIKRDEIPIFFTS